MARKFIDISFDVKGSDNPLNATAQSIQRQVFEAAKPLARRMSEAYQNNLKTTLVRVRAIATGSTLRSVRDEMLLESPSRQLIQRRVTASRSILWVQFGRRPGKAPIKYVGTKTNARGKTVKWFEPLDSLVQWFLALSIPRAAWMPIARAIGRRGVKPREVQVRAVRMTHPVWLSELQTFGVRLSRSLFK